MKTEKEFIFGVQYYRAPTPEPESWEADLKNMKENGFDHVKFWVQWRWTHRDENEFYFEDIDRLMDLAWKNGLKVTLNVIFDVIPKWLSDRYPDSKMVLANGTVMEPIAVGHRQIGGFPGPCYNHQKAYEERMKFLKKTVERYRNHPAMHMWDVWNEPEQCGPYREAKLETLTCYCDNCREKFKGYLTKKYKTIEKLNHVWGKCFRDFDDMELPGTAWTFTDFIDYREFHLDSMTAEANSRLRIVREADQVHPAYLHVVPNTSSIFNALTGVDDFQMAKECDVFASTNFAKPVWSILTLSAGAGKTCYNVECHIGTGSIKMHPKQVTLQDMAKELLPQIGMGIRGFMFWQYRAEILGHESPAWGATKPDGSMGCVGKAAKGFIDALRPYIPEIMKSEPARPEIAIWKGRKNEILSFCINGEMQSFAESVEAYIDAAYYNNYNCCIVDDEKIAEGLDGVKLLIMPSCYEADTALLSAVDSFVKSGGMLLCEAHLGGYNADTGRHSYTMPGCGMDQRWKIKEDYTTSSYYLKSQKTDLEMSTESVTDDVRKAIDAFGVSGGKFFPVRTAFGFDVMGAERFACLEAEDAEVVGRFGNIPCMILKEYGKGRILYCGTNLGQGAAADREAFEKLVIKAAQLAGVSTNTAGVFFGGTANVSDGSTSDEACNSAADEAYNSAAVERGVHLDLLSEGLLIVHNSNEHPVTLDCEKDLKAVFGFGKAENGKIEIGANSAELFEVLEV